VLDEHENVQDSSSKNESSDKENSNARTNKAHLSSHIRITPSFKGMNSMEAKLNK